MPGPQFGSVYVFNIYTAEILSINLNGLLITGSNIAAPPLPNQVTPPALPYTPNGIAVPKTNQTMSQGTAGGLFMVGQSNINQLQINFDGDNWLVNVYIPGSGDGLPLSTDLFCYVAYKQLYIFDNDGRNILQPPKQTQSANVK